MELPIVDFTSQYLKPGTPVWDSVKAQVRKSLEEFGCFEASFDKVPIELRNSVLDSLPELFDLPLETKIKNSSKNPFYAYVGPHPTGPYYESIGVSEASIAEKIESFTNLMWPQGKSSFSKTILSYSDQLSELEKIIRRMVLESCGLEKYIDEYMDSTEYFLKFTKYTAPQMYESTVGLRAHTDKNIVSILQQNQVKGLEVLKKDGQWIEINFSRPDSFIVLTGESLVGWMNGRLHSPSHRVMIAGNDSRYSVGLFSYTKAGYIIKVPEELVDEEHPLLFKPFDLFEFLDFCHTEAGLKCQNAIKAYCGV